jgi:hypothetical protein
MACYNGVTKSLRAVSLESPDHHDAQRLIHAESDSAEVARTIGDVKTTCLVGRNQRDLSLLHPIDEVEE